MSEERKAFKDYFDRAAVKALADQVAPHVPDFDRARFSRRAARGLNALEMMDRVRQIAGALRKELPESTAAAMDALTASLPPPLPDTSDVTGGYLQWPVGQLIADHGTDDFDASFRAMVALTQRFSSEFAVRPFLIADPERVIARLMPLTDHPSPHVRRWCSEGVRPRLPWGQRAHVLEKDPSPILPLLEALKDDPEEYVRRSVANALNDIAKAHPALVVSIAERWWKGASKERERLVRHGLRTLIKAGDPGALAVLGYGPPKALSASLRVSPPEVSIGESVQLSLALSNDSRESQPLLVDYQVHYVKADGSARPKVFKWKELTLESGAGETLTKKHSIRRTTTRPLYAGEHRVEALANGEVVAEASFSLLEGLDGE